MSTKTTKSYITKDYYYVGANRYAISDPVPVKSKFVLVDSRSGDGNLAYRSKIAAGTSATNHCTGSRTSLTFTSEPAITILCVVKGYPSSGKTASFTHLGYEPASPGYGRDVTLESAARNSAAIGVREAIRDSVQAFSGMTFLGELRETIHMIKSPAKSLRDQTLRFLGHRSRDMRRLPKKAFSKVLAETWLEYAFGVAPLINDISNIASAALPTFDESRIKRTSFTGYADGGPPPTVIPTILNSIKETYSDITTNKMSVRYIVGIRREVQGCSDPLRNIISLGGFHLDDVIPTAWELLPWSFFIDYFSNIGDVISANYVSLSNVAWVNETIRWTNTKMCTSCGVARHISSDWRVLSYTGRNWVYRTESFERRSASIPYGTVRFELPGSHRQFMNMAALLRLQNLR